MRHFEAFINPVLVDASPERLGSWEHCLSVAWGYRYTDRASSITVRYREPAGPVRTAVLRDDEAVVFQQELDHLEGVLLNDGLTSEWFIPADRIGDFAAKVRTECGDTSRLECNEVMEKQWTARARSPGFRR